MNLDIFKPKTPPLFGLDISSSSVKMLEIVEAGKKGGYQVERHAIEPLPKDAVVDGNINNLEAVAEAVKRGHKRLATRTKHVAMAVPSGAVITKKIVVSAALREEDLEVQVQSEANQYIPFALEEVNLDFQIIGPSAARSEDQEVLIAATRKEKVEDRVAVAESAGLKAIVMDVESYAQMAALGLVVKQLPNGGIDQNIAVVDVGANVMNVTVLRNEQSVYTREQAFGGNQLTHDIVSRYGMSPEEAENAKRSGGLPDDFETEVLRPFMDNLSMEVQRALQFFFTSTSYNQVDHILLAGGSAVIAGLDEVVYTRTHVPAMVANPFAAMQTSPRIQLKRLMQDAPSLIIACGLALRRFDPA
ncbi:MAG: pilus assembly protein PilM [Betaproteobacteria bacterium]|nr:pilus assembly protein PilM [Betaproteobacteria bacterium]